MSIVRAYNFANESNIDVRYLDQYISSVSLKKFHFMNCILFSQQSTFNYKKYIDLFQSVSPKLFRQLHNPIFLKSVILVAFPFKKIINKIAHINYDSYTFH